MSRLAAEPSEWAMGMASRLPLPFMGPAEVELVALALDVGRAKGNAERDADVEQARAIIADGARALGRREGIEAAASDPGMRAVLADCRARLSLALSAVELGAYPGPEWRAGTAQLIALLDTVKP